MEDGELRIAVRETISIFNPLSSIFKHHLCSFVSIRGSKTTKHLPQEIEASGAFVVLPTSHGLVSRVHVAAIRHRPRTL